MQILQLAGIPFLVGGAYALRHHVGIERDTKDFDVMMRACHVDAAMQAFRDAGYRSEVAFPHWIAKAYHGEYYLDIIYNSGNGLCPVDDDWFRFATSGEVLGMPALLVPPEEMIWQKAFIMERERFDGADIAHLIKCCRYRLDWQRLVARFGKDVRVLMAHLLLAQFIYPEEKELIPAWVLDRLCAEIRDQAGTESHICNGTLLSRAQYLIDIERWDYADARLDRGAMNEREIRIWTDAIRDDREPVNNVHQAASPQVAA